MNNTLLLANLYIIAAYFMSGFTSLILIAMGFLWLIIAIFEMKFERSIDRLDYLKFENINLLLKRIIQELEKSNKKKK